MAVSTGRGRGRAGGPAVTSWNRRPAPHRASLQARSPRREGGAQAEPRDAEGRIQALLSFGLETQPWASFSQMLSHAVCPPELQHRSRPRAESWFRAHSLLGLQKEGESGSCSQLPGLGAPQDPGPTEACAPAPAAPGTEQLLTAHAQLRCQAASNRHFLPGVCHHLKCLLVSSNYGSAAAMSIFKREPHLASVHPARFKIAGPVMFSLNSDCLCGFKYRFGRKQSKSNICFLLNI